MGVFASIKRIIAGKSLILPGKTGLVFCEYIQYVI